jgi:hypothetical protein
MEIKNSYFIKQADGTTAWLSINKEIPKEATVIEERPMLVPSQNMVLHKKGTDIYCTGIWLKNETVEDWEEVESVDLEVK